jgi:hypothetical protein
MKSYLSTFINKIKFWLGSMKRLDTKRFYFVFLVLGDSLTSLEEIKPHCDCFNEWIAQQKYSTKPLGTVLSRAGFYKKFKSILLKPL